MCSPDLSFHPRRIPVYLQYTTFSQGPCVILCAQLLSRRYSSGIPSSANIMRKSSTEYQLPSCLQAVPSLPLQIVTLVCWAACRTLLYSSFYTVRSLPLSPGGTQ